MRDRLDPTKLTLEAGMQATGRGGTVGFGGFPGSVRALTARPGGALVLIFGLAAGLRGLAFWLTAQTPLAGDELEYYARAVHEAVGPPLPDDSGRAPGAIALYAAAFRGLGVSVGAARAVNVLASSLTVFPAYWLGRAWGGARVGLWGAAAVAVYPTFIAFSHFLWSEPLYLFWLSCALALLVSGKGPGSWGRVIAAGALLGVSGLTKESGLIFVPLAAGWIVWKQWGAPGWAHWGRGLGLVVAAGLVVSPWVAHINGPGLPLAAITRTGGMNLFIGNHPVSHFRGIHEYGELAATPRETERIARERALAEIRRRLPAWPVEKLAEETPRFFTPTSFAVRRLLAPSDDPGGWRYRLALPFGESASFRGLLVAVAVASYAAALLGGAVGWVLARRRDVSLLFGLVLAAQILPSIVTFSMSRFRVPSMLFFLLGSAVLAVHRRRDWAEASPRRRSVAVALAALLLALMSLDYESVLHSSGN